MSTTHQVRLFQARYGDEIARSMDDWLKANQNCKFVKIVNVDTRPTWSILATVECGYNSDSIRLYDHFYDPENIHNDGVRRY